MVYVEKKYDSLTLHGEDINNNLPSRRGIKGPPPSCFEEIWPALQQQFVHEMSNLGGFRLIFSEENSGKYAQFLDKDVVFGYSEWSDESFLKPRPEVVTTPSPRDHEPWSQDYVPESLLKVTKTGQVYVETTHPRSGPASNQEYMKFKYNPPNRSKNVAKKDTSLTSQPVEKSIREGKNKAQGDENTDFSTAEEDMKNKSAEKPVEVDKRTPAQIVHEAIERLRWKGMSGFSFLRVPFKENTIKCRPTSGSSQSKESDDTGAENCSAYPNNHCEREIGTFSRPTSARLTESRRSPYSPTIEVTRADLPTLMKDFTDNTKERKTRTDKAFVKDWVTSELKKLPSGESGSHLQTSSFPTFSKDKNSSFPKSKRSNEVFVTNWIKSLQQPMDSSIREVKRLNTPKTPKSANSISLKPNNATERRSRQRKNEQGLQK